MVYIAVYLLSAVLMWRYLYLAYSKSGRWDLISPDILDIVVVITPILNTIGCLMGWLIYYPIESKRKFDFNRFFRNVKK